jgi:sugar/nucleoside kinase (ribokinase family)
LVNHNPEEIFALSTSKIIAYGNPVYDVISTPLFRRTDRILSGCSTNACLVLAKLGQEATLVGTVGSDFENMLRSDLSKYGIQSSLSHSEQTGGFSLYYYDEHGNRELTILGVADPIPSQNHVIGGAVDFILLGPIMNEISVELVQNILQNLKAPILLDPQGLLRSIEDSHVVHSLSRSFEPIARLSTIVKANEIETQVITGINPRHDPERAVKALHQCGCKIAISTLAEVGSIIFDGSTIYKIPPFTTNAVDPTGAGDTYAGGFIVKYMESPGDLSAAGCFASAVASVMVENIGPDFPLTRAEADRRSTQLLSGPLELKI